MRAWVWKATAFASSLSSMFAVMGAFKATFSASSSAALRTNAMPSSPRSVPTQRIASLAWGAA
ncbi:hypothetical protein D3C86_1728190 [compost metagenome]